jgi:hypothetical protein
MIEPMGGPFRYRKNVRRQFRRSGKKAAILADKLETEGFDSNVVASLRRLAETDKRIAKARKKKKFKNPN